VLIVTWLLIRSVFPNIGAQDEGASPKVS
jgi:hypothetical protein